MATQDERLAMTSSELRAYWSDPVNRARHEVEGTTERQWINVEIADDLLLVVRRPDAMIGGKLDEHCVVLRILQAIERGDIRHVNIEY